MSESKPHIIPGINSADLMKKIMEQGSGVPASPVSSRPSGNAYSSPKVPGLTTSIKELGLLNPAKSPKDKARKLKGLGEPQRSDVVKEVLESPPAWLIRWGSTWVMIIIAMILAISWFVEYPDLVKGLMQVTGTHEASAVSAPIDGILEELYVEDGEKVEPEQIVGRLETLANPESVNELKAFLEKLERNYSRNSAYNPNDIRLPEFQDLGTLQSAFQSFANKFQINKEFGNSGLVNQKITYINNDLQELSNQLLNLYQQQENYRKDYALANEEYQNQKRLNTKGLISQNELRAAESKALAKKQTLDQTESAANTIRMQQNQKRQEILELQRSKAENGAQLKQEVDVLLSQIQSWERQHYLRSLSGGSLYFHRNLQLNQPVSAGQPLFFVMPDTASWYGQMVVGQYNIGKVAEGQRVILKFQGYPYQEFGSMEGLVSNVSDIPVDSVYVIRVKLPEGLKTTTGKKLNIRSGMTAEGEIVTEDLRLIEKVFYEIRRYLKR